MEENKDEPCLVKAGQGSRVLNTVSYKNRFLYSKYDPERAILRLVQSLNLLPGSLLLLFSPCLWYGTEELLQKLPEGTKVLALEADEKLYSLSKNTLSQKSFSSQIEFYKADDFSFLDSHFRSLVSKGEIRRVVRVDMSAGVLFESSLYEKVYSAAGEIVERFWKNRITLVKFGRLYFKNFFSNLQSLPDSCFLSDVKASVSKPLLVLGAGESLDKTLASFDTSLRKKYFLLAADASLPSLLQRGIKPDAVVGVEAQFAIQKAYIGSASSSITLFADIFSRPQIKRILGGRVVWFSSELCDTQFISSLKNAGLVKSFIPALGSVGLYAVYIALALRQNDNIPVYLTGLDFSYTYGATHAKNTPAHLQRLFLQNRLSPLENFESAFAPGCKSLVSPEGKVFCTTQALTSYGETFVKFFSGSKNLFDSGRGAFPLSLPYCFPLPDFDASSFTFENEEFEKKSESQLQNKNQIEGFLLNEKNALLKLRSLLSKGESSEFFSKTESLSSQIETLLLPREYLYLHFPDGYSLSMQTSFLKRVRAEIDYFLKYLEASNEGS